MNSGSVIRYCIENKSLGFKFSRNNKPVSREYALMHDFDDLPVATSSPSIRNAIRQTK